MSSNKELYKIAINKNTNNIISNMNTKSKFACLSMDDSSDDEPKIIKKVEPELPQKIVSKKIKNNIKTSWTSLEKPNKNKYSDVVKKEQKTHIKPIIEIEQIIMEENKKEELVTKTEESHTIELKLELESESELDTKSYKFQNSWYIWVHEVDSKDWSAKSYKIVHGIETLYDFWQFFNNVGKLNQWKYNFFIMKANSHPTWEHSSNRNGGTCSIRIDISQSIDIIEQLAILLVNESLTEEINDINGISFAAKGNWCVIKIWNRDNKNNISNQMPSYLRKIYPAISIKYKENIPEY